MNYKLRFCILSVAAIIFVSGGAAFAEDDLSCNGVIEGYSCTNEAGGWSSTGCVANDFLHDPEVSFSGWDKGHDNQNVAVTNFNPHPLSGYVTSGYTEAVEDLSIALGDGEYGQAPASRQYAACLDQSPGGDQYPMKGYAWNTNVGFISFYCGSDHRNLSMPCGNFEYGVTVGPEAGAERELTGHAWNPILGYISFEGSIGGGGTYGVTAIRGDDGFWYMQGHAWSQAGLYLNMDGIRFKLSEDASAISCEDMSDMCFELRYSDEAYTPENLAVDYAHPDGHDSLTTLAPFADGDEGYEFAVYLRKDGEYLDPGNYELNIKDIEWVDTLKFNQTGKVETSGGLDNLEDPWSRGEGGVVYKPVDLKINGALSNWTRETFGAGGERYLFDTKISSYAPTDNANISWTTSTNPPLPFSNWSFFASYDLKETESNVLELKSLTYDLIEESGGGEIGNSTKKYIYEDAVFEFPPGLRLKFRPPLYVDTLSADGVNDYILGNIGLETRLDVSADGDSGFSAYGGGEKVSLSTNYTTGSNPKCSSAVAKFGLGEAQGEDASGTEVIYSQEDSIFYQVIKLYAKAYLLDPETSGCEYFNDPALNTKISYNIGGRNVSYYSNKLPRIGSGEAFDSSAVIHGNIYAQYAKISSGDDGTESIFTSGDVILNVVRDTINRNLKRYIDDIGDFITKEECSITDLVIPADINCSTNRYDILNLGTELVYYFRDVNLTLDAEVPPSGWGGKIVIIVEGGNLFIREDLYTEDEGDQLVLVVLKDRGDAQGESGNTYIHFDVKNIVATLFADGGIMSYDSATGVDPTTGEPENLSEFFANLVSRGYQLKWQGSLSSPNTIGGAVFDEERGVYYERASRPTDSRLSAQLYDLNYLRLFRFDLHVCGGVGVTYQVDCSSGGGWPIDQSCKKGLNTDEMLLIEEGGIVMGLTGYCNGIDASAPYDPSTKAGDLMPTTETEKLAKGLYNLESPIEGQCCLNGGTCPDDIGDCEFYPIYVFYEEADSFLLKSR